MKINKSELKKIIKEEVGNAIDEGLMDMFKKKSGFDSKVVEKWGLPTAGGGGRMMEPAPPAEVAQIIAKAIASPEVVANIWSKAIAGKNTRTGDAAQMRSNWGHVTERVYKGKIDAWSERLFSGAPNTPLPAPKAPTTTAEQPYLPQGQYYLYYDEGEKKWRDPREDPKWAELIQQEVSKAFQQASGPHQKAHAAATKKREDWLEKNRQHISGGAKRRLGGG